METERNLEKLSALEERFVEIYVADPRRNAGAAVLEAGYKCTPESAYVIGCRLLKKVKIQTAVQKAQDELLGPDLKARVVARLSSIAFTNLTDLAEWDAAGRLKIKTPTELTTMSRAAILEISSTEARAEQDALPGLEDVGEDLRNAKVTTKIKLHDPLKAMDILNRMGGFYAAEKHDLGVDLKDLILSARRNAGIDSGQEQL